MTINVVGPDDEPVEDFALTVNLRIIPDPVDEPGLATVELPNGSHRLRVAGYLDYMHTFETVEVNGEDVEVTIRLREGFTENGFVLETVEHLNEGEPNVSRVTFRNNRDEEIDLSSWTMETEGEHTDQTYEFDDVTLNPGETYDVTNEEFPPGQTVGFLDYAGDGDTIIIRNADGNVVLEEDTPPTTAQHHIGIFRVVDQDGNPVEGETVTMYHEAIGEETFETDANGTVEYSVTNSSPTDALLLEATVRDQTVIFGVARGTSTREVVVDNEDTSESDGDDQDSDESNESDEEGGSATQSNLISDWFIKPVMSWF